MKRHTMAEGCCSAVEPCSHQRQDPTTICDNCKLAAKVYGDAAPQSFCAPLGSPVLTMIADKAREWAGRYPPHSDGQNTFVLFAEWVESLPAEGGAREAVIEECAKVADAARESAKEHHGVEASIGADIAARRIRALLLPRPHSHTPETK